MSDRGLVPARPPRAWELGTLALLLAAAGTGALSSLLFAAQMVIAYQLITDEAVLAGPVSWYVDYELPIAGLNLLFLLGCLIGLAIWRRRTRAVTEGFTPDPASLAQHWTLTVWNVAFAVSYLIRFVLSPRTVDSIETLRRVVEVSAIQNAIRVAGIAVLIAGILIIRGRVRHAYATSGVWELGRSSRASGGFFQPVAPATVPLLPDPPARTVGETPVAMDRVTEEQK